MHLYLHNPVSTAGFTASAFHIKGKTPFCIAPFLCILGTCKEISNQIKNTGIGRRIRTGSSTDGTLVDGNHLIQIRRSFYLSKLPRHHLRFIQGLCTVLMYNFIDKRRLSRTRNAGHTSKNRKRNRDIDIF